jgi:uncharacterized protein YegL
MKSNSSVATSDVNAATADDGGSTYYVQALSRVAELFSRKQAAASKKNQRNFVVFLSDGAPDDRAQVRSSAQGIADQAGAVFFTVATGGDGAVLQEMAGLVPSSPHPNHRGQYFQAAGQAALATTFRQVGDSLKALCPK